MYGFVQIHPVTKEELKRRKTRGEGGMEGEGGRRVNSNLYLILTLPYPNPNPKFSFNPQNSIEDYFRGVH